MYAVLIPIEEGMHIQHALNIASITDITGSLKICVNQVKCHLNEGFVKFAIRKCKNVIQF